MKMALALPVVLLLTGCPDSYKTQAHQAEPNAWTPRLEVAKVTHVEQVEESYSIKVEKYLCRAGAGMSECTKKKQVHQPAGVATKLLRSNGTTVSFFVQDPSSFLAQAQGETVCVEAMESAHPSQWVVVGATPNTDDSLCGALLEVDPPQE